ncbi:hypothetical protein IHE61_27175 [Streptomyces sp. GKU 257-1]|nr:hypothetical protein [Streptomyces sp. GKU 257-1]
MVTLMRRKRDGTGGFEPYATENSPWAAQRPDGTAFPPPFVYGARRGSVPPPGTLADLAYRDPALRKRPEDTPVITTLPLGALPELARNTGKTWWGSTNPAGRYFDQARGVHTLAVFPADGQDAAPTGTWRQATADFGDSMSGRPLPASSSASRTAPPATNAGPSRTGAAGGAPTRRVVTRPVAAASDGAAAASNGPAAGTPSGSRPVRPTARAPQPTSTAPPR